MITVNYSCHKGRRLIGYFWLDLYVKYIEGFNSDARNSNVLLTMLRLGYVEDYGSGLPRIMNYKEVKRNINIKATPEVFKITLPNINYYKPKDNQKNNASYKGINY